MQKVTILALALVMCNINAVLTLGSNNNDNSDNIMFKMEISTTATNDQDSTTIGASQTMGNTTSGKCLSSNIRNIVIFTEFSASINSEKTLFGLPLSYALAIGVGVLIVCIVMVVLLTIFILKTLYKPAKKVARIALNDFLTSYDHSSTFVFY
jgi:hypothetical protein